MRTINLIRKTVTGLVLVAIILQTASCGTLLYPERRNSNPQNHIFPEGRRIDPAVAIMDAACLVFFVVPGIIAFAVDFTTGAIYLPGNRQRTGISPNTEENIVIHFDKETFNADTVAMLVEQHIGIHINFDDKRMQAYVVDQL